MYKPENLLYNTLKHKNNTKTPKVHKTRLSPKKMCFSCALWKRRASGDLRR
ncbi:hypothetical protein Hanom_Chr02g00132401 [Helianthus anomalus]